MLALFTKMFCGLLKILDGIGIVNREKSERSNERLGFCLRVYEANSECRIF